MSVLVVLPPLPVAAGPLWVALAPESLTEMAVIVPLELFRPLDYVHVAGSYGCLGDALALGDPGRGGKGEVDGVPGCVGELAFSTRIPAGKPGVSVSDGFHVFHFVAVLGLTQAPGQGPAGER